MLETTNAKRHGNISRFSLTQLFVLTAFAVAGATNCAAENIGIWQKCQSVTKKKAVTCHILLPYHPNRSYGFFPILIHILKI
jgi:hypothetical protein